jgi:hypothetical protein
VCIYCVEIQNVKKYCVEIQNVKKYSVEIQTVKLTVYTQNVLVLCKHSYLEI